MIQKIDRRDLYYGSILGLALGDALGVRSNGLKPGTFELLSEPSGGGAYKLDVGEWTDETSTSMCLAESVMDKHCFNGEDYKSRLRAWSEEGFWSCRDFCFSSGEGIRRFIQSSDKDVLTPDYDGPETLVCTAPISLYFMNYVQRVCIESRAMVTALGASEEAQQCSCVLAMMIVSALMGEDKETLLQSSKGAEKYFQKKFSTRVIDILEGAYRGKPGFNIDTKGSACNAFEAALWGFASTRNFKEGALRVVNLGGAAESAGAIYGQLAGAYYGCNGIPDNWIRLLARRQAIEQIAKRLWKASITSI